MTILDALGCAILVGMLLVLAAQFLLGRASGKTCAILAIGGGALLMGSVMLGLHLGTWPEPAGLIGFIYVYGTFAFCAGVTYFVQRAGLLR